MSDDITLPESGGAERHVDDDDIPLPREERDRLEARLHQVEQMMAGDDLPYQAKRKLAVQEAKLIRKHLDLVDAETRAYAIDRLKRLDLLEEIDD
ncbi:MAG: hypothetical protein M3220_17380 [Chloroflexota bacterium]|nr:hypothetical protein [Chloroflexota bacterium]